MINTESSNNEDCRKIVEDVYQEILLRDADSLGLDYFSTMLKKGTLTINDIRNTLYSSEEAKSIRNFTHYSDKYWNDLEAVLKYKNKLSTGNENTHWIEDIVIRFDKHIPFEKVLIVGCGNGWLERNLFDLGIGLNFDAFDISEKYIQEAEEKKGKRSIRYFIDDVNNLQNLEPKKYDAIFNFAILHHATEVENAMKKLSITLKPEGLIFNEEYVGPARNQYSDAHLQIMLEVMSDMPQKFRSKHILRPQLELLTNDFELTKNGKVPTLFWYCVGKPKIIE